MFINEEQGWLRRVGLRDVRCATLLLFSILFVERECQINLEQIADRVGDLGCLFMFF